LHVIVHSAGIQDRDGAVLVLDKIRQRSPWLELIWADAGTNAPQVKDAWPDRRGSGSKSSSAPTTSKASSSCPGDGSSSEPSWFGRNRRLAKDYENLAETLAAFVTLAAIQFAIRRLARM
jgi:hypothetical protein